MKKFREHKGLNLTSIAEEQNSFWLKENIFKKSISSREGNKPFVFYEGPPSANGLPGIHHVMARSIKDIFCRYKTLKGFKVDRKAGWDTHGLPVELGVEKELGITKEDIGKKISVEQYNDYCKEVVMRYTDKWNELTQKMGYWVDMEKPYVTYHSKYMESVWWLLSQIYKKGLLYKGYTIQPYSPAAGTGLSSHELNQPGCYRDVSDTTIIAQFKVKNEDFYILAWTTTPWTLPSNTALAVGENIDYVLCDTKNQYTDKPCKVVVAKNLIEKVFGKKIEYSVLKEFKGKDIVGLEYEQLLPFASPCDNPDKAFRVISGDFVSTEDGTGIVHIAPTFGSDDKRVAEAAGVPPMLVLNNNGEKIPLVDLQGRFIDSIEEPFAGMYVKNEYYQENPPEKSLDVLLAIKLKEENKAFKVEKHLHSYPHCWRTDKPVLYYPLDSWFIKISDIKDRLYHLNDKYINWKPASTGTGRFGNWLASANDWNLSRSRFWGIPLPIWRTEDKKEEIIIDSAQTLLKEIEKSIKAGFMTENPYKNFVLGDLSDKNYENLDLHKHIVDKIVLVSQSAKKMYRETDLIDVWFDSGAMPFAQHHYPFENKELIDKNDAFPADFIAEGVDQTRGWFYTLHAISSMVKDSVAYKNVISNGLVLDKNGQKMSKRLGNAVDPFQTLQTYGADATRWYMISNAQPWDNLKFDLEGLDEVRRKFFGTLYNTYSFFALYANLDGFRYSEGEIPLKDRPEIDRWVLSELHTLIKNVDDSLGNYEPTKATRDIQYFVGENLSNWFVRLSRRRFWKDTDKKDKLSAYQTLYVCLETVAKLSSVFAPFYSEQLFRDLNSVTDKDKSVSVHLSDFPKYDTSFIDKKLEQKMQLAQKISSMGLSLRKKHNLRVRQPLSKIFLPFYSEEFLDNLKAVENLILSELNIKKLEIITDDSVFVKQIKADFKKLGPLLGKDMKDVAQSLKNLNQKQISAFEKQGFIELNGYKIPLDSVEVLTNDIEGSVVISENGLTVAIETKISPELRAEGLARELVNRVQNLRKDKDFELTDRIILKINSSKELKNDILQNNDYICSEILANKIEFVEKPEDNFQKFALDDDISCLINIQKN